uniref:Uncharacterized protein n=1 Tax=Hyaloperonospora arabidopsidis (strain Emoy2) TaxID=559515 RepID=M4BZ09_HYAAE
MKPLIWVCCSHPVRASSTIDVAVYAKQQQWIQYMRSGMSLGHPTSGAHDSVKRITDRPASYRAQ